MDNIENVKDESITQNVLDAYNDVLRKLKDAQNSLDDNKKKLVTQEDEQVAQENAQVIAVATQDTPDNLVRHLSELKQYIGRTLDDVKMRLLPEYEKFFTIRKAISLSEMELDELYRIKVNADTLTALIAAQKEKVATYENEMSELRKTFARKKLEMTKSLENEEAEYVIKRDAARKLDQEKYDNMRREAEKALAEKRAAFEEELETREARIAAREREHQQLKEREARILARDQEYQQLKDRAALHADELRQAVHKVEKGVTEKLTNKYEYEAKLLHIEIESERKMYKQKINALEEQIAQYKTLKQSFAKHASLHETALPLHEESVVASDESDKIEDNLRNFGSLVSASALELTE